MATALPGENLTNTIVQTGSDTSGAFSTIYTVPASTYARVWIKFIDFAADNQAEVDFLVGGDVSVAITESSGTGDSFSAAIVSATGGADYTDIGANPPFFLNVGDIIRIKQVTDSEFFIMEFEEV